MKTLALAGLMTISAVAGSLITVSLSQTSVAQENKPDDGHWTQQHPTGQNQTPITTAQPQSTAGQLQSSGANRHYTEYKVISAEKNASQLTIAVTNAMIDGWQPQGGLFISCGNWDCNYFQAVAR